jgi:transcriptional regulator with XRE-family HTH domain
MGQNITIEQIKAARGLVGWSQKELAERTNISKTAINNLERHVTSPRIRTLNIIQQAFETAGVEFIDGPGVRLRVDRLQTQIFEGRDAIALLWNDVAHTLERGQERLINGVEEDIFIEKVTWNVFSGIMHRYKRLGITGRILTLDGDRNFADITSEYRWISQEQFSQVPSYIYGDKYAIVLFEPVLRVLVIENAAIAESYRKLFNTQWDKARKPPGYTSPTIANK